jgi:hypothetical protein
MRNTAQPRGGQEHGQMELNASHNHVRDQDGDHTAQQPHVYPDKANKSNHGGCGPGPQRLMTQGSHRTITQGNL